MELLWPRLLRKPPAWIRRECNCHQLQQRMQQQHLHQHRVKQLHLGPRQFPPRPRRQFQPRPQPQPQRLPKRPPRPQLQHPPQRLLQRPPPHFQLSLFPIS